MSHCKVRNEFTHQHVCCDYMYLKNVSTAMFILRAMKNQMATER